MKNEKCSAARIRYMKRKGLMGFASVFFFFQCDLQQLPIKGIWAKSLVKTFWFIAEEQWTDNDWVSDVRVSMLRSRNSAKNELLLLTKLRERLLSHERCCSLWLRYDS